MHTIKFQRLFAVPLARRWMWFAALAFALFVVAWEGRSLARVIHPGLAPRDFFQEWASAKNAMNGLPIYTLHLETIPLYLGIPARPGRYYVQVNAHPPVSVLLALPFVALDYPNAHFLWNLGSLAVLGITIAILARSLDIRAGLPLCVVLTLLLFSGSMKNQLFHGQLNLVLLLLLTGIWWADRSERPVWAGTMLGIATAIKLFPGLLFVCFLLRRQGRALIAGVASLAGCCLTACVVLGPGVFQDYRTEAMPRLAYWQAAPGNCSVPGLMYKLFNPGQQARYLEPILTAPFVATFLIGIFSAAILVLVARTILRARSRKERDLAFGLTLVAMLLISPITWDHYFLLLLLPLALLWKELPPLARYRWAFLCILAVLWLPQWRIHQWGDRLFNRDPSEISSPLYTLTVLSAQLYALVGLLGLTWLTLRRLSHSSVPSGSSASSDEGNRSTSPPLKTPLRGEGSNLAGWITPSRQPGMPG